MAFAEEGTLWVEGEGFLLVGFLAGLLVEDGVLGDVLETDLCVVLENSKLLKASAFSGSFKLETSFSKTVLLFSGSNSTESMKAV